MTDYKTATLKELGLEDVEFPEGFTPRWYAGEGTGKRGELHYFVYRDMPQYFDKIDLWAVDGYEIYEIGVIESSLLPEHSLVKIVSEEEEQRLIYILDYYESGCRCILNGTMPATEATGWDKVEHYGDNCKCGRRCK